jgi:ribosomal protein S24E
MTNSRSDILHPNRANISKDELRGKLAEMYKATAAQVNVFGLQTQFGGGKTTGFALVYDSPDALKKFEPHYRLVRIGLASKIEKPSRQQRTSRRYTWDGKWDANLMDRQATQEQTEDTPGYGEGQGCQEEEGLVDTRRSLYVEDGGFWCCGNGHWLCMRLHWLSIGFQGWTLRKMA